MRIKSIGFRNVGPFGAQGIRLEGFTPGLNVVCETNEFGKSTVLKALEMILFKPFSSADKQVKALRTANSEDGPEGEITFSSDGREYRFSKRFLKSKGARLQDLRSGADVAIDRAAEEVLATLLRSDQFEGGPSGLLWVRQGRSMDGIADNGQIASRLEGELGTLVGGERVRDYLRRVEVELSEILTPRGQEKKGGPLKNAREAVEVTEEELAEARRLRDLTTSIGAELNQVEDEIERLNGAAKDENLAQQIASTREAVTKARQFTDALALLEAKRAQAALTAERAAERQATHIAAQVSYNESIKQLKMALQSSEKETVKLNELEARRQDVRKRITDSEAQQEKHAKAKARQDAMRLRTQRLDILQRDIQSLRAGLDQLQSLETKQSKLTNEISDLPSIARKDVEMLRLKEANLRQYEIELSAFSTRLYLDLSAQGGGKITLGGKPLQSGPVELTGGASLLIDGIGELRSDDSRLREITLNRDASRDSYKELLERFGVATLTEATKFADERQALEAERKRVTADMIRLAPEGRAAIEINFNAAQAEARGILETVEDEQLETAEEDENDLLERLRAERATLEVVDEALTSARHSLAKLDTESALLRERVNGLNLPADDDARKNQADALAGDKLKTDSELRAIAAEVEALKSRAPDQSLDMLMARLSRLEQIDRQSRGKPAVTQPLKAPTPTQSSSLLKTA